MSLSPAERYAISRQQRRQPRLAELRARGCASTSTRSSAPRAPRSTTGAACSSPRRPARARRSSPSSPSSWPCRSRARRCSTPRRSRRSATRSSRSSSTSGAPSQVGLLTGDTNINSGARIVVMTTEVLRNMLYADSPLLDRPRLRRHGRGALPRRPLPRRRVGGGHHPPPRGGAAGLAVSATVSNAEEFGDWLQAVRGDTDVIVSEERPVPLEQHVLVKAQARSTCSTPRGRRRRTG